MTDHPKLREIPSEVLFAPALLLVWCEQHRFRPTLYDVDEERRRRRAKRLAERPDRARGRRRITHPTTTQEES